jgi:hypothetical protein
MNSSFTLSISSDDIRLQQQLPIWAMTPKTCMSSQFSSSSSVSSPSTKVGGRAIRLAYFFIVGEISFSLEALNGLTGGIGSSDR